MYNITIEDIINAGRDMGMRISVESSQGFSGDRRVAVSYNEFCHKSSVVHSIVCEMFDAGDKVTIFGDVNTRLHEDGKTYDAFLSFSVDRDSITIRDSEENDATGSDSASAG